MVGIFGGCNDFLVQFSGVLFCVVWWSLVFNSKRWRDFFEMILCFKLFRDLCNNLYIKLRQIII